MHTCMCALTYIHDDATAKTNKKMKVLFTMLLSYVPSTNILFKCHMYVAFENQFMCKYKDIM